MSEILKFEVEHAVAVITLNRPDRLNAFNRAVIRDWIAALEECERTQCPF